MKSKYMFLGSAFGMLLLILDGRTSLAGAQEGIDLCLRSVIPALFPFFLLSILLTGALDGISAKLLKPIRRLFHIPKGTEGLLLTGLLGGYPIGAQCISSAYQAGQISANQANRMLAFCNNAGPSFLFGIVGAQFPGFRYPLLLWLIQIVSTAMVARMNPVSEETSKAIHISRPVSITDAMKRAVSSMAMVCGWVVLFRVVIAFCQHWFLWLFPKTVQAFFCGILELTNGCCALTQIENIGLRFILCAVMLCFGGLCVTMQTLSVISGLDGRSYLTGKLLQSSFAISLGSLCQFLLPAGERLEISPSILIMIAVFPVITVFLLRKMQNNSRNPRAVGV